MFCDPFGPIQKPMSFRPNGSTPVNSNVHRTRSFWALLDQGAISAGNFVTTILLARGLAAEVYGIYALLFGTILFLNNIHAALITYPLCVLGAETDEFTLRRFASRSLSMTALISVGELFILSLICLGVHRPHLILPVFAATIAWQFQESMRSVFVARIEQRRALLGDAVSYLGQASVVGLLLLFDRPSLDQVFWIIAATSVAAFGIQAIQSRVAPSLIFPERSLLLGFWKLGGWSLLGKVAGFFTLQALPWILAFRSGPSGAARFQVLLNILAVSNPILFGINSLVISTVARERRASGLRHSLSVGLQSIKHAMLLIVPYFAIVALVPELFLIAFYGRHSPYLDEKPLLRLFAAAYLFEAASLFGGSFLAGWAEAKALFSLQFWGMAAAIVLALPMIFIWGLPGAVGGLVIINFTRASRSWYEVWRLWDSQSIGQATTQVLPLAVDLTIPGGQ